MHVSTMGLANTGTRRKYRSTFRIGFAERIVQNYGFRVYIFRGRFANAQFCENDSWKLYALRSHFPLFNTSQVECYSGGHLLAQVQAKVSWAALLFTLKAHFTAILGTYITEGRSQSKVQFVTYFKNSRSQYLPASRLLLVRTIRNFSDVFCTQDASII